MEIQFLFLLCFVFGVFFNKHFYSFAIIFSGKETSWRADSDHRSPSNAEGLNAAFTSKQSRNIPPGPSAFPLDLWSCLLVTCTATFHTPTSSVFLKAPRSGSWLLSRAASQIKPSDTLRSRKRGFFRKFLRKKKKTEQYFEKGRLQERLFI